MVITYITVMGGALRVNAVVPEITELKYRSLCMSKVLLKIPSCLNDVILFNLPNDFGAGNESHTV